MSLLLVPLNPYQIIYHPIMLSSHLFMRRCVNREEYISNHLAGIIIVCYFILISSFDPNKIDMFTFISLPDPVCNTGPANPFLAETLQTSKSNPASSCSSPTASPPTTVPNPFSAATTDISNILPPAATLNPFSAAASVSTDPGNPSYCIPQTFLNPFSSASSTSNPQRRYRGRGRGRKRSIKIYHPKDARRVTSTTLKMSPPHKSIEIKRKDIAAYTLNPFLSSPKFSRKRTIDVHHGRNVERKLNVCRKLSF